MRTLVAALLALALAAGCGGDSEETPVPEPDTPLISFSRGGGLAGDFFGIEIRADGIGSVETGFNGPDQRTIEFELSEGQLDQLVEHLEQSEIASLDQGTRTIARTASATRSNSTARRPAPTPPRSPRSSSKPPTRSMSCSNDTCRLMPGIREAFTAATRPPTSTPTTRLGLE